MRITSFLTANATKLREARQEITRNYFDLGRKAEPARHPPPTPGAMTPL
jgi:hypothetical protein